LRHENILRLLCTSTSTLLPKQNGNVRITNFVAVFAQQMARIGVTYEQHGTTSLL
jgi:hypothetical protein